ncbi:MAG: amidase [Halodesulfurarchaeum sp.]
MSSIHYTPATELADRIQRGDLSPVTVVDAFLDRIEERDPEINAFVTVAEQSAREAARDAAAAVERGDELGPLHGVPVAIKDLNHVAGMKTTFGSKPLADFVPEKDDHFVRRLKAAGAIVIGKTNTPEFGRKPMTTNEVVGATGNPWDPSKTAAGSSGGSAAALAEGMVPLAQGSDAAGSIRAPSSACGVVGLMPDFGRVPQGPRADQFVNTMPFTFVGPMARSVEDLELMLSVMAGHDADDPFSLPDRAMGSGPAVDRGIGGATVAYSPDLGIDFPIDPAVSSVVEDALAGFESAGATVERADPAFDRSWEEVHEAISTLLQVRYVGMYDTFQTDSGVDLLDEANDVTPEVVSRIEKGLELDAMDLRRAETSRTKTYRTIQSVFDSYDYLVTPTLGLPPFPKNTKPQEIAGTEIDPLHGWMLTWPFNLTGNPAASVPAGFTADGLPVGLQIVGPRHGDADVLAASRAFERQRPWADAYPPS